MNDTDFTFQGWRLRALILSVIVAAGGYLAFSLWVGWQEVVDAFFRIGLLGTAVVLLMSMLNYLLRFFRWQMYLNKLGCSVGLMSSLRIYLSGFALTTTPGKAGEAFRGILLSHYKVPYTSSFAALISERLSDLLAVVLLTLLGLTQYPEAIGVVVLTSIGILVILLSISNITMLNRIHSWSSCKNSKLLNLISHISNVMISARFCHSMRLIIYSTFISLSAWLAEAFAFYWVLNWLGSDISIIFAVFIYALSMLVGALSFLPGGLGSAETVMISMLVFKGMTFPSAVAATVFIRLATLWFAVLIGLFALFLSRYEEQNDGDFL